VAHRFIPPGQTDDDTSEAEAIRLAREGDPHAFELLYKLHSPLVYGLCLRIASNPAEAEDLTQEAFLQIFRKIQSFRRESKFSTWLYRLAINVVLKRRRNSRYPEISLDATVETEGNPQAPHRTRRS